MQKIRERKAKDKKLKDIMSTLEQSNIKDESVYDLMTSASTMKKDNKKYELAKQKLNIPDTPAERKIKEKQQQKMDKKKQKVEQEKTGRVRLLSQSDEDKDVLHLVKDNQPAENIIEESAHPDAILTAPDAKDLSVPVPLKYDAMEALNELLEELNEEDEESLAEKHSNKYLRKVNLGDAKPDLHPVERSEEMEKLRQDLPVFMHEKEVLESVENNLVTIICGETGSGKSTQVPQFLYEYGYTGTTRKGMIGITQPRRVAATSLSKRIADELNFKLGEQVGYQIRYDRKFVSQDTAVKLMTDGILLKELELDHLLEKYSVIIIDEAHERSINTDILISLLSRIVRLRLKKAIAERSQNPKAKTHKHFPLRLVIMSATLRVDDFMQNKRLFPHLTPRVIKVESRQFSVDLHFSKVTKEDYEEETFKKICKIHTTLPSGGILVFMTGKKEIEAMVERLKAEYKRRSRGKKNNDQDAEMDDDSMSVQVLPLYSMLSPEQQLKVFNPPQEGHRLIVISTNIAETSITIPNIRYVVDCGREKQKVFDPKLRLSKFLITWVSQASANQRAGRAGRTGPGH